MRFSSRASPERGGGMTQSWRRGFTQYPIMQENAPPVQMNRRGVYTNDYFFWRRITFQESLPSGTLSMPPSITPPLPLDGATFSGLSSVLTAFTSS